MNYHIAAAVRGPDYGCDNLKAVFTCRIRYFVGLLDPEFAATNDGALIRKDKNLTKDTKKAAEAEAKLWYGSYAWHADHFIHHVMFALDELSVIPELKKYKREINSLTKLARSYRLKFFLRRTTGW
jgi:hypothetical protein